MFLKLIESFDIYSGTINKFTLDYLSKYNIFLKIYHEISFNKVRWVMFFIVFFAFIIFYINLKNIKNNILLNTLLSGFNQNLKSVLIFKKINFLNWLFVLFIFILLSNCLGLIPETIALNSIFLLLFFYLFECLLLIIFMEFL